MENNVSSFERAFILRMAHKPGLVTMALEANQICIGYSHAKDLLNEDADFRNILRKVYFSKDKDERRAGQSAGEMLRFIKGMQVNDIVIIPCGPVFYIAKVTDSAYYDEKNIEEDTAYRRPVQWLNEKKPFYRQHAGARLQSRMKSRNTCVLANDIIEEIKDVIKNYTEGKRPTFEGDLREKLIEETLREIRFGKMNPDLFEKLILKMLYNLGAKECKQIGKRVDKGADLLATFIIANLSKIVLAVQVKHYNSELPVEKCVIDQLIKGMDAELADLGWVVTSGIFSEETEQYSKDKCIENNITIELIDGNQLATLIVENGLNIIGDIPVEQGEF